VLTGQVVDLHDLIGTAARELVERCAGRSSVADRFRLVADWIAGRIAASPGPDPAIAWTAGQIDRNRGAISIAALRAETGWSKARLAGTFREQVGVVPKLYARVVRFGRVLNLLQAGAEPLAQIAVAAGYYDQPHMNADFRQLGGIVPSEFLAARHPVGDGTTAADP
jgi:AraC-like DNA-binding protein